VLTSRDDRSSIYIRYVRLQYIDKYRWMYSLNSVYFYIWCYIWAMRPGMVEPGMANSDQCCQANSKRAAYLNSSIYLRNKIKTQLLIAKNSEFYWPSLCKLNLSMRSISVRKSNSAWFGLMGSIRFIVFLPRD